MEAIDTPPHELGHAHGRHHAPCGGATDTDPKYPYAGARTGSWGYSVVTRQLQPPTLYDQMSYCAPAWQSDYTYRGLFDRVHALATLDVMTNVGSEEPTDSYRTRAYRMLKINADGSVRWAGKPFQTKTIVQGAPQPVTFTGAHGEVVGEAIAHGSGYDHLGGGILLVPYGDAAKKFERVRIDLRGDVHPMFAPARAKQPVIDLAR